jgi:SAM-dependent methyltransferase
LTGGRLTIEGMEAKNNNPEMPDGWEEAVCPLCRRETPVKLVWADNEMGGIVRCLDCAMTFRNPRRSDGYLSRHFKEEWTEIRPPYQCDYYWDNNLRQLARNILRLKPVPGTILDIGSSYGHFLRKFPHTWGRLGVEPSITACEVARTLIPDATIINRRFSEAQLPDNSVDVITSLGTIYFQIDPLSDLASMRKLLKPDGILVVEAQNYTNRGSVYRWLGHRFLDNFVCFYTPDSLAKLMNKAGFAIIDRWDFPGHRVGSQNPRDRLLAWLEFYLLKAFKYASFGKCDLIPHFALIGRRVH